MLSDSCYCGYCREKGKNYNGFDAQDGQWLEEMGDMIAAAVKGRRKVESSSAGCLGRLATT